MTDFNQAAKFVKQTNPEPIFAELSAKLLKSILNKGANAIELESVVNTLSNNGAVKTGDAQSHTTPNVKATESSKQTQR